MYQLETVLLPWLRSGLTELKKDGGLSFHILGHESPPPSLLIEENKRCETSFFVVLWQASDFGIFVMNQNWLQNGKVSL